MAYRAIFEDDAIPEEGDSQSDGPTHTGQPAGSEGSQPESEGNQPASPDSSESTDSDPATVDGAGSPEESGSSSGSEPMEVDSDSDGQSASEQEFDDPLEQEFDEPFPEEGLHDLSPHSSESVASNVLEGEPAKPVQKPQPVGDHPTEIGAEQSEEAGEPERMEEQPPSPRTKERLVEKWMEEQRLREGTDYDPYAPQVTIEDVGSATKRKRPVPELDAAGEGSGVQPTSPEQIFFDPEREEPLQDEERNNGSSAVVEELPPKKRARFREPWSEGVSASQPMDVDGPPRVTGRKRVRVRVSRQEEARERLGLHEEAMRRYPLRATRARAEILERLRRVRDEPEEGTRPTRRQRTRGTSGGRGGGSGEGSSHRR